MELAVLIQKDYIKIPCLNLCVVVQQGYLILQTIILSICLHLEGASDKLYINTLGSCRHEGDRTNE